jgi:hypothetical protein
VFSSERGAPFSTAGVAIAIPGRFATIAYGLLPRDVFISWSIRRLAISSPKPGRRCAGCWNYAKDQHASVKDASAKRSRRLSE